MPTPPTPGFHVHSGIRDRICPRTRERYRVFTLGVCDRTAEWHVASGLCHLPSHVEMRRAYARLMRRLPELRSRFQAVLRMRGTEAEAEAKKALMQFLVESGVPVASEVDPGHPPRCGLTVAGPDRPTPI